MQRPFVIKIAPGPGTNSHFCCVCARKECMYEWVRMYTTVCVSGYKEGGGDKYAIRSIFPETRALHLGLSSLGNGKIHWNMRNNSIFRTVKFGNWFVFHIEILLKNSKKYFEKKIFIKMCTFDVEITNDDGTTFVWRGVGSNRPGINYLFVNHHHQWHHPLTIICTRTRFMFTRVRFEFRIRFLWLLQNHDCMMMGRP